MKLFSHVIFFSIFIDNLASRSVSVDNTLSMTRKNKIGTVQSYSPPELVSSIVYIKTASFIWDEKEIDSFS